MLKGRRLSKNTVGSIVGILVFLAVGLAAGSFLSHSFFDRKEIAQIPKLSDIAAPPEKIGEVAPSTLPPIGLSPVPPKGPWPPRADLHGAAPETPLNIPWAEPYPAHSFTLTDQNENQISLKDFSGRVVLVNFIYTHCKTVCPLETQELKKLQQALGPLMRREVVFLSITIDPKRDTVDVLRQYGEGHGVDFRSWRFLTGSDETIRGVLQAYHVAVTVETVPGAPEGSYELGHGAPIYLIDQWGRVRKRTALPMLVRIGRQAIEHLVRERASHGHMEKNKQLDSLNASHRVRLVLGPAKGFGRGLPHAHAYHVWR